MFHGEQRPQVEASTRKKCEKKPWNAINENLKIPFDWQHLSCDMLNWQKYPPLDMMEWIDVNYVNLCCMYSFMLTRFMYSNRLLFCCFFLFSSVSSEKEYHHLTEECVMRTVSIVCICFIFQRVFYAYTMRSFTIYFDCRVQQQLTTRVDYLSNKYALFFFLHISLIFLAFLFLLFFNEFLIIWIYAYLTWVRKKTVDW